MTSANPITLVWLRRDLRLHDHAAFAHALRAGKPVQAVFVFDSSILDRFTSRTDRRLSFIADALCLLDAQLKPHGGGVLALYGRAQELVPKAAATLNAAHILAGADFEPASIRRDEEVKRHLPNGVEFKLLRDHVIFAPAQILNKQDQPFKVFTPYSKAWKAAFTLLYAQPYEYQLGKEFAPVATMAERLQKHGIRALECSRGAAALVNEAGYDYAPSDHWPASDGTARLEAFMERLVRQYADRRNYPAKHGTSRLSPYLRFGLVSVRECVRAAMHASADTWLNELIWREFYIMTLYHAPESLNEEWNEAYRRRIPWNQSKDDFKRFCNGETGYPIVDAAMRELLECNWMHNRARMITASFLTKHLLIDWRWGEEHFAQHLMDYEAASNVGGWQWAASTGTDAQPYFRIFNPTLQSRKFDPEGEYIRRFVPELRHLSATEIHEPWKTGKMKSYPMPMVEHDEARQRAIRVFKEAKNEG